MPVGIAILDSGLDASLFHWLPVHTRYKDCTLESFHNAVDSQSHGSTIALMLQGRTDSNSPLIDEQHRIWHGECITKPSLLQENHRLHIYRVFEKHNASPAAYYACAIRDILSRNDIQIVNWSIGTDGHFLYDKPVLDLIQQLIQRGITVVAAIGNGGPLLDHEISAAAQLPGVLSVGAWIYNEKKMRIVAPFSSRGYSVSTRGRIHPLVLAPGCTRNILSSDCHEKCGTSMSAPHVTALVAELMELWYQKHGLFPLPGLVTQWIIAGAKVIPGESCWTQGAGIMDRDGSLEAFWSWSKSKNVALFPSRLDMVNPALLQKQQELVFKESCPYLDHFCWQALMFGMKPRIFPVSVYHGCSNFEWNEKYQWQGADEISVQIQFNDSEILVQFHLKVDVSKLTIISGNIHLYFSCDGQPEQSIQLPIRAAAQSSVPRQFRIAWDLFHQKRYPSAYFPSDELVLNHHQHPSSSPFEKDSDHPFVQYRQLSQRLITLGYFIDVIDQPWTCINAENYAVLVLVDMERDWSDLEVKKLNQDATLGLDLVVTAGWYSNYSHFMKSLTFKDSTRRVGDEQLFLNASLERSFIEWVPFQQGACHLPSLNALLMNWGVVLGTGAWRGERMAIPNVDVILSLYSTSALIRLPAGAKLLVVKSTSMQDAVTNQVYGNTVHLSDDDSRIVLGALVEQQGRGRLAVWSESLSFQDHGQTSARDLFVSFIRFASSGRIRSPLREPLPRLLRDWQHKDFIALRPLWTNSFEVVNDTCPFNATIPILYPTIQAAPWKVENDPFQSSSHFATLIPFFYFFIIILIVYCCLQRRRTTRRKRLKSHDSLDSLYDAAEQERQRPLTRRTLQRLASM